MTGPLVRADAAGALLRVRVSPGASRDRVRGRHGDALKVSVQAPPERGRANRDVARLLARALGARPADVEVVQGATSRDKTVRFAGWTAGRLRAALDALGALDAEEPAAARRRAKRTVLSGRLRACATAAGRSRLGLVLRAPRPLQ